jgi:HD-GYP domain-containing protein (c-di-GMP phosphodiesterase class II)
MGAGYFLHDIGKVRLDPAIINKQGKLTDEEMRKMRTHPYEGYRILSEADQLTEECKIIVMQHHEREDGNGYPLGLKGDGIHPYGRVCSIADVYDALTAVRSYKSRQTPFEALDIMKKQMISHFHRELFEEFVFLMGPGH